jgi:hypothetical protein
MASVLDLEQDLAIARTALFNAESALADTDDPAKRADLEDFIRRQKAYISGLLAQIAEVRLNAGQTSAGDILDAARAARSEFANTQIPDQVLPGDVPGAFGAATNAVPAAVTERLPEVTAAATRAQDLLQGQPTKSIANISAGGLISATPGVPGLGSTRITGQPGVAATPDDGFGPVAGTNSVQTAVDSKFDTKITASPNILDRYASYTYSVSIYIMNPGEYRQLIAQKVRRIPPGRLLIQSGGISAGDRNQQFPLDFYIDDLEVRSIVAGKGSGGAHNVADLRFKIVETNGITLINNLRRASLAFAQQQQGSGQSPVTNNYAAQNYLMVIRFYGYDEQGSLLRPDTVTGDLTDRNAIIEKFIPFQFTEIKFRVASRVVEYDCSAVAPQNGIATGQGRGTIPYNIQLTSDTLQDLLTVQLAGALNKFQKDLVEAGTYTVADEYEIVLVEPELQKSSIVPPGPPSKRSTPMPKPATAKEAKDAQTQTVNSNQRTKSAVAGSSIVQFIDLAVRNSDYIFQQQTKIKIRDRDGNEQEVPQGVAAQSFGWYRIGTEVTPIGDTVDPKRNDYAYRIRYTVSMYGITDMNSEYFPRGKYRGEHKRYNYWFTGENNSILNYEQDFNYLFYTPATGSTTGNGNNTSETARRVASPNSGQTNQGDEADRLEPAANAADFLYSPGDQGQIKLEIVGDPAWIQQGDLWRGAAAAPSYEPFLPDGTINFEAREAVFLVTFKQSEDYNINTGIMEVR